MSRGPAAPRSRPAPRAMVAALALAASAVLALDPAGADGIRGGGRGALGGQPSGSLGTLGGGAFRPDLSPPARRPAGRRDHPGGARHDRRGAFSTWVYPVAVATPFYGAPAAPPPDYGYAPAVAPVINIAPVFYNAPSYYEAPPAYAPAASPPAEAPRPTVVEYATGRHELRGDGISSPHVWVWVPNPPPPPTAAPAPSAPPAPPSGADAGAPLPAARSRLYRWVDAQGTVHLTNSPEAVPEPHRAPAPRAAP